MKDRRLIRDNILKYAIFFSLAALLCWFFPYTGDDWAWGSTTGIERLQSAFSGYGGRYMGYLMSIILTRSNLLKTVVMAFAMTAIVFLIERITRFKYSFWVGCMLLIAVPTIMFREAVVWTSGFANYCFSMVPLLLYMNYTKCLFSDKEKFALPKSKWWRCIGIFLLAIFGGLFVEHLTVFNVAFSAFVIIYSRKKYKRWNAEYITYFVGAVSSAVLMFSNAAYTAAANGTDHYRQFAKSGIIKRALYNFIYQFSPNLIFNNVVVNLLIILLLVAVIRRFDKKEHPRVYQLLVLCESVMALCWGMSVIQTVIYGTDNRPTYLIYLDCAITLAWLCAIVTMIFLYFFYISKSGFLLVLLGSAAVISAPLLAVDPVGNRCFFPIYIFWILIICLLSKDMQDKGILQINRKLGSSVVLTAIALCYALHLYVYVSDFNAVEKRIDQCRETAANGEKTILLEPLPYDNWLHAVDPENETYLYRFKDFYGLPQDIQIIVKE